MGLKPPFRDEFLRCIDAPERREMDLDQTAAEAEEKAGLKLERELQSEIARYLRLNDIPHNVHRMDKKWTGTPGWPDINFLMIKQPSLFFECKRPGQTSEPHQIKCQNELRAAGALVWEVHSIVEGIQIIRKLRDKTKP